MWNNLLPTSSPFSGGDSNSNSNSNSNSKSNSDSAGGEDNGNDKTKSSSKSPTASLPFPFLAATSQLTDRLLESLERTGEAVTQRATAHVKQNKNSAASTSTSTSTSTSASTSTPTIAIIPPTATTAAADTTTDSQIASPPSSPSSLPALQATSTAAAAANKLKNRFTFALERTTEAVAKNFDTQSRTQTQTQTQTTNRNTNTNTKHTQGTHSPALSPNNNSQSGRGFLEWTQSINENLKRNEHKRDEMLSSLKTGWGSMVEATIHAVETTKQVVEKEQTRMTASLFKKGSYRRDISLPLDTEALCDAEVVYITDRLITMGHPAMQSPTDGDITADRKLAAVSHLLQKRHHGRYMVWNLSELDYDYAVLDDQVMTFRFPGSPSPPLGLWLKIIIGMESWLKADGRNVAVVHCLTGRGRTSTTLAAFLCWMGEAGFGLDDAEGGVFDANGALEYIAKCKRCSVDSLTIPSQRRYVTYFKNMMDGIKPSQPPLLLKRIIMSEAPKFGKCPKLPKNITQASNNEQGNDNGNTISDTRQGQIGCAPYLQIFKGGKLVFTTAASRTYGQGKDDLPFCLPTDGPITFPIETVVQGDMLVRCRHLTRKGQRVSMFRTAVHTGYVPPKVLRLTKAQLDGACHDDRYVDDFFIDLIFEECDAAMASRHILSNPEENVEGDGNAGSDSGNDAGGAESTANAGKEDSPTKATSISKGIQGENIQNEAAARRMMGTIAGSDKSGGVTATASAYDSMLHRDSRFWDIISERREENRKKKTAPAESTADFPEGMPVFYGPTIGRRREFARDVDGEIDAAETAGEGGSVEGSGVLLQQKQQNSINSFSIGGELDFTEEGGGGTGAEAEGGESKIEPTKIPEKDDLMEALMAIDDDLDGENSREYLAGSESMEVDETEMEEIVFEDDDGDAGDGDGDGDGEEEVMADTAGSAAVTQESETPASIQERASIMTDGDKEGTATPTPVSTSASLVDDKASTQDESSTADLDEDASSVQVKTEENNPDSDVSYDDSVVDTSDAGSFDFDAEDEDLEDLENFLMKAKEK